MHARPVARVPSRHPGRDGGAVTIMHALGLGIVALALAMEIGGCTAITSGEFEERRPARICGNDSATGQMDLVVSLTEMNPHMQHVMTLDLVRIRTVGSLRVRQAVARAVYEPLGASELDIVLPCTIRAGVYEVDLHMDSNQSGSYDACPEPGNGCADHQWRLMVQADGTLQYRHDIDFANLAEGAAEPIGPFPLTIVFRNVERYAGLPTEIRLRQMPEGGIARETTFLYRLGALPADRAPMERRFDGLITSGARYEVVVWIDQNGNGTYDPPSAVGIEGRDYAGSTIITGEPGGTRLEIDGSRLPPSSDIEI